MSAAERARVDGARASGAEGVPELVSIVLPTHNGRQFLSQAIESCLTQTYRQLELIVVDDTSTDDTSAILSAVNDPRLRVVRHAHNRGLPAALNTGFAQ